jgi:hypothetical protein
MADIEAHCDNPECMCQETDFVIDQEAVRDLVEEKIGLRLPVEVEVVDHIEFDDWQTVGGAPEADDPSWGRLWMETDQRTGTLLYEVTIQVLRGLSAEAAVRTILHEVEHIRQYCLDGDNIIHVFNKHQDDLRANGYYAAEYETKANNAEREWLDRGNLLLGR